MRRSNITQAELKELLHYDPDKGVFTNKVTRNNRAKAGAVTGCIDTSTGYVSIGVSFSYYRAHRLAWLYMTGSFPSNDIDHIDGNRANNRWSNIRCVTASENNRNRRCPDTNKSGVIGVSKKGNKWSADIFINGRSKYLGLYPTIEAAAQARQAESLAYNFHPNHGRTAC
jgi:hypothetical protein